MLTHVVSSLDSRLSKLHGIIIDKVWPDQLLYRQPGEFYHSSDVDGKEKVERT